MRIVICEDEAIYMEPLKRIITQWSVDNSQARNLEFNAEEAMFGPLLLCNMQVKALPSEGKLK